MLSRSWISVYEKLEWSSGTGTLTRQQGEKWIRFSYFDQETSTFYSSEEIFNAGLEKYEREMSELLLLKELTDAVKKEGVIKMEDYNAALEVCHKSLNFHAQLV